MSLEQRVCDKLSSDYTPKTFHSDILRERNERFKYILPFRGLHPANVHLKIWKDRVTWS